MAALGLTWVRIGEFSWHVIEPHPGEVHWDWLDEATPYLGRRQDVKDIDFRTVAHAFRLAAERTAEESGDIAG